MSGPPAAAAERPIVRTFDPFRVPSADERRRHLAAYERFLETRDGAIDLAARTLSGREIYFRDLEEKPVKWEGEIEQDGARAAWLGAIAEANQGENYGVGLELNRFSSRGASKTGLGSLYLYLLIEEHYHCRILVEACRACGLDLEFRRPGWGLRCLIHLIQRLPAQIRWIPVLCGETLGTIVFKLLRDRCHLFSAQPEVEERLRALLSEIWLDETLHVALLRARLGAISIRCARLLAPLVAMTVMKSMPQILELGYSRHDLLAQLRSGLEIPPGIDWIPAESTSPAD